MLKIIIPMLTAIIIYLFLIAPIYNPGWQKMGLGVLSTVYPQESFTM
jgi:hypothetical protein